jgi:iron complex transport system permease protein
VKTVPVTVESIKISTIILLVVILAFVSLLIGRYPLAPSMVLRIFVGKALHLCPTWTEDMEAVLFKIRLPRILAAMMVGAALSASGAAYQGMFRNPLVSPDILGVSAGASFGAALAILLSWGIVGIQVAAFGFGLFAVMATYVVSTRLSKNRDTVLVMILAGVIVGALFASFVSLIKYIADPANKLPAITYWLMGSLASVDSHDVRVACIPILAGLIPVLLVRWKLNVMSFGDEEAKTLGVNTGALRFWVIVCATLMTASAVSISGTIGLVGLIVPHLARLIVGPNYKALLPMSIVMGALFLLGVDDLARTMQSSEIPLGIITSIVGAPIFLYLLLSNRGGWTS